MKALILVKETKLSGSVLVPLSVLKSFSNTYESISILARTSGERCDLEFANLIESKIGCDQNKVDIVISESSWISYAKSIGRMLSSRSFVTVYTHSMIVSIIGRVLAKLFRVKVIHTVHGLPFNPLQNKFKQFFIASIDYFFARFLTFGILTVNRKYIPVYSRFCSNVESIYNGVDLIEGYGSICKDSKKNSIVFLGRFEEQKNPILFVNIINEMKEYLRENQLIVEMYGDGSLFSRCVDLVEKYKIQDLVVLHGWTTKPKAEIFINARVLVCTSLWEAFGLNIIEANSNGVPCIAFALDGIPEVIEDNLNGCLVDPNSGVKEFSERLTIMLNQVNKNFDPDKIKMYVKKNFDINLTVVQYENYIRKIESLD